jgi:hypothetical protein
MHKTYLVSIALMLLTACGASVTQGPANDRGLIDLNRELTALPTGGPSPYGSAYGAHQGDRAALASVDLDAYLKPEAKTAKRVVKPAQRAVAVVAAAAKQPAPVMPAAQPQVVQAAPEQLASAQVTAAPADDSQRYAAREQQPKARALENYKAGDAIVITSGALIVILLVVILVLLLT